MFLAGVGAAGVHGRAHVQKRVREDENILFLFDFIFHFSYVFNGVLMWLR